MLEQPRPGNRTVFGDVTDDERRAAGSFGELHQRLRAVANLRDAARVGFRFGQPDGLDRVDDDGQRRAFFQTIQNDAQVRFGEDQNAGARFRGQRALRAQLHLRGRFFAADVDDVAVGR